MAGDMVITIHHRLMTIGICSVMLDFAARLGYHAGRIAQVPAHLASHHFATMISTNIPKVWENLTHWPTDPPYLLS